MSSTYTLLNLELMLCYRNNWNILPTLFHPLDQLTPLPEQNSDKATERKKSVVLLILTRTDWPADLLVSSLLLEPHSLGIVQKSQVYVSSLHSLFNVRQITKRQTGWASHLTARDKLV